ncbi:MAG: hypothetical protein ACYC3X_02720 [Pirellulaceae bacterium]
MSRRMGTSAGCLLILVFLVGGGFELPRAGALSPGDDGRPVVSRGETESSAEAPPTVHDAAAELREPGPGGPLTRDLLDQSLALGRQFLLTSQLPAGLFRYHVNFLTGEVLPEQSPIRQAGALWGVALIHQDQPSVETRTAVLRGLAFFSEHSQLTPDGRRFICFPGDGDADSGAVALVALSLIDFLRAEPVDQHVPLRKQLDEYLLFLWSLERPDHRFYRKYLSTTGEGWGQASPYFDGEILLACVKAARFLRREDWQPRILQAADASYTACASDAVQRRRDDPDTKGFFQWACLAFAELYASHWPQTEPYAQRTIELAHWMIDVHKPRERPGNTAYAYEGIVTAYSLARDLGDVRAEEKFRHVIDEGLAVLTTWQVGSRSANAYLRENPRFDPSCLGGVLGAANKPWLRVDTTQHQMHAVILARRHLWSASEGGK